MHNSSYSAGQPAAIAQAQKQALETVTTSVRRSTETVTVKSSSFDRTSPRGKVCKAAKRMFNAQLSKTTETKRGCLSHFISRYYGEDAPRFWLEMQQEAEKICDSKRFCSHCENLGLNPQWVAEHLLVEGATVVNKVLKDGFGILNNAERLFDSPLVIEEDLKSKTTAA